MTSQRPKTLNFITGNANKLSEVRAILADVEGLNVQSRDIKGLNEIQGTIEEVAIDKCSRAAEVVSHSYSSCITFLTREEMPWKVGGWLCGMSADRATY